MIERIVTGRFEENTYLISNKSGSAFVIDPGEGLEAHIEKLAKYDVKFVLITHGHIDHIAGINLFKCPIYVYQKEMPFFFDSKLNLADRNRPFDQKEANIVFYGEEQVFSFEGNKIKFIKTPGHTSGGVCYVYNDNVFTGDTLFKRGYGRVDLPTGNAQELIQSINYLFKNLPDNYRVYPGHDQPTTIGEEKRSNLL